MKMVQYLEKLIQKEDLSDLIDRKVNMEEKAPVDVFIDKLEGRFEIEFFETERPEKEIRVPEIHEYEANIESEKLSGTGASENYFQKSYLDIQKTIPFATIGLSLDEIPSIKIEEYGEIKIEEKRIELSQKLIKYREGVVGLSDDWDGQGSKGFDEKTWIKTEKLLKRVLYKLWNDNYEIPIPLVLPLLDGSFDINWETDSFELLVNIPASDKELVHFYGEKIATPEAEIDVKINYNLLEMVLMEWMKKIL